MTDDVETLFQPPLPWNAVAQLDEAEFDTFSAAYNAQLDCLFLEAQSIARKHPEWFNNSELTPREMTAIAAVRDADTLPDASVADQFVRCVHATLSAKAWEQEMDQFQVDAALRSDALHKMVVRKLMSFSDFQCNVRTGQPDAGNPDNVRIFFRMQGHELRWNSWWQRQEIDEAGKGKWTALDDAIVGRLMTQAADTQYQFRPADALFRKALETIARENIYDPVVEHLAALQTKWDGKRRLSTWLSRACGVPCDPYHQAVSKNLIGGMVKRARQPGCKHDEVVILIGPQGTFKSTLCRTLAGKPEYFTDSVAFDGSPQNLIPQLFGKLVVELAELDGMANRETSFLKRFISAQSDNVTLKFHKHASDHPRRCIFVGTTNDDKVLRDATGNRRFLPVRIANAIDIDWVRENLDQLLGEAAAFESLGADFEIPNEVVSAAQSHQESARVEADFETHLEGWFDGSTAAMVEASDVALLLREATGKSIPANRYGGVMRRLGFVDMRTYIAKRRARVWLRGAESEAHRITLIRDSATGRLTPRHGATLGQMAAMAVPPMCPTPRS